MKRELTPLAVLAGAAGPYMPVVLVGGGVLAVLAWLLSDEEAQPPVSPTALAVSENPKAPTLPEIPELPTPDARYPRHASGKFASVVTLGDLRAVFANGPLSKADAVEALCSLTGCSRSAAYHVLTKRLAVFLSTGQDGRLIYSD